MIRFADRAEAGERLASRLEHLRDRDCLVLGLPRGGVPVGFRVAERLGAPLDVLLVRKLGAPGRPELALGAIGEGGVKVLDRERMERLGVSGGSLREVEERERAELERQASLFRAGRPGMDPAGRTAVIVDDGVATGSTALAACRTARRAGAARVVMAAPVAPRGWEKAFTGAADECAAVAAPARFWAIGLFYRDFSPTPDAEVMDLLSRARAWPAKPVSGEGSRP